MISSRVSPFRTFGGAAVARKCRESLRRDKDHLLSAEIFRVSEQKWEEVPASFSASVSTLFVS